MHKVRLRDGSTAWLVTRYADQRQVFRDPRISASPLTPGYPKQTEMTDEEAQSAGFILMDDQEHQRLRRMVTAPFAVEKVQAMRPVVQKIVDLHDEERRREGMMALGGYLYQLLEKKQAEPADDLLSDLAEFVHSGEIDPIGATTTAVLLLFAGHETTANMIALGTLALLERPDQLALLRDSGGPALYASAVEELLRFVTNPHRVAPRRDRGPGDRRAARQGG